MADKLTLELHGDENDGFYTVNEFWDCECEDDFIRIKNGDACSKCHYTDDESPDSRLIEVLDDFPELNDVPWVFNDGTEADKNEVRALINRYLKSIGYPG